jgi:hypothetical protein
MEERQTVRREFVVELVEGFLEHLLKFAGRGGMQIVADTVDGDLNAFQDSGVCQANPDMPVGPVDRRRLVRRWWSWENNPPQWKPGHDLLYCSGELSRLETVPHPCFAPL